MKFISELEATIQNHLGWNKARVACFTRLLVALFMTRTVNLKQLACAFESKATLLSRYRRLQSKPKLIKHGLTQLKDNLKYYSLINTEARRI